jgi:hypothetical protein
MNMQEQFEVASARNASALNMAYYTSVEKSSRTAPSGPLPMNSRHKCNVCRAEGPLSNRCVRLSEIISGFAEIESKLNTNIQT